MRPYNRVVSYASAYSQLLEALSLLSLYQPPTSEDHLDHHPVAPEVRIVVVVEASQCRAPDFGVVTGVLRPGLEITPSEADCYPIDRIGEGSEPALELIITQCVSDREFAELEVAPILDEVAIDIAPIVEVLVIGEWLLMRVRLAYLIDLTMP